MKIVVVPQRVFIVRKCKSINKKWAWLKKHKKNSKDENTTILKAFDEQNVLVIGGFQKQMQILARIHLAHSSI